MSWWLASVEDQRRTSWVKRFDPVYWTVDFPRPMMASAVTTGPASLRVDAVFYQASDLAGLIWSSEDTVDHPLLRLETSRDYRTTVLSFRWRSTGLIALDAVFGPTLTIEGRDAVGAARTWYVRLWNYAVGTAADAVVTIDFKDVSGGFLLPAEADPVWAGDVDRMFISLAPEGYSGAATPFAAPIEAWVELSEILADGAGSTLKVGDAFLPEHKFRAATGYDDQYVMTPERLLRNIEALGYRKWLNHYVGMSHHFRLHWRPEVGTFEAVNDPQPFNVAFIAWHADLLRRAREQGLTTILSLSYELYEEHAPEDWRQRRSDGSPAQTGYTPPSTLLSPASAGAQQYLERCAAALAQLSVAVGVPTHFQVGEPWWWVGDDRAPCVYDDAARSRYTAETGQSVPAAVTDIALPLSVAQESYFDWAGTLLARSTIAVAAAARQVDPRAVRLLLFYAPQVVRLGAGKLVSLNMPTGWANPAFDVFQYEDYDFVLEDDRTSQAIAQDLAATRLGYPTEEQHYLAGFVLDSQQTAQWHNVHDHAERALCKAYNEVFIWALPQILRDGFCCQTIMEDQVAFDDVLFPIALGLDSTSEPVFSTAVVTMTSGHEQRNSNWSQARLRFEIGSGIRSEEDLRTLLSFFRARRGRANGFRFRDPIDNSSSLTGADPMPGDQLLGVGDGTQTRFQLVKVYAAGGASRQITRPVSGSVRVAVSGIERKTGWRIDDLGILQLDTPASAGHVVSAGYRFDVPVRFQEDNMPVSLSGFRSGVLPSASLVEIREG